MHICILIIVASYYPKYRINYIYMVRAHTVARYAADVFYYFYSRRHTFTINSYSSCWMMFSFGPMHLNFQLISLRRMTATCMNAILDQSPVRMYSYIIYRGIKLLLLISGGYYGIYTIHHIHTICMHVGTYTCYTKIYQQQKHACNTNS